MFIYPLSDGASGTDPYVRGTALTFVATDVVVLPDGTNDSIVRITLDLTGADVSDEIELVIDPALAAPLTANGGVRFLDQDADGVVAEASEDVAIDYITVSGSAVTLAVGAQRDPQANVSADGTLIAGFSAAATTATLAVTNSAAGTTNITTASLTASFLFRKYTYDSATNIWSLADSGVTASYDDAGTVTFTFPAATPMANLDMYRVDWDPRSVTESAATLDFIHFGENDQTLAGLSANFGVGTFNDISGVTPTVSGDPNSTFVDIVIATGTEIAESTVNANSVRLYNETEGLFVPTTMIADVGKIGTLTLRIGLAQPFRSDFGGDGTLDDFVVVVFPTLLDDNGTPTDSTDDNAYGSTPGSYVPGVASGTFDFGAI